jgi:membrane protein implicated in regulation of membrane protease activity
MDIAWLRDLIIVIFGIAATVAIIAIAVLAFMLYFRVKPVVGSVEKSAKTIERITTNIEETVVKPITQIGSFLQGIRNALEIFKRFFNKEEEE